MQLLKPILFVLSMFYFGLAILVQLTSCFLLLDMRLDWFFSLFGSISEGFGGLLILGFVALFILTIVVKAAENQKTAGRDASSPGETRRRKRLSIPALIMFLLFVNAGASFWAFATVTHGGHGSPEIYDGRYVMAYRGKVVREIDEETYERESRINRQRTMQLIASFMLVFAGGVFFHHMPETKGVPVELPRAPLWRPRRLARPPSQVREADGRMADDKKDGNFANRVVGFAILFVLFGGIGTVRGFFEDQTAESVVGLVLFALFFGIGIKLQTMSGRKDLPQGNKQTYTLIVGFMVMFAWFGGLGLLRGLFFGPVDNSIGGIGFLALFFSVGGGMYYLAKKHTRKTNAKFLADLHDADPKVREQAANLLSERLGKVGDPCGDLTQSMLGALKDDHAPVRLAAATAFADHLGGRFLEEMQSDIARELVPFLKDEHPAVRRKVALALANVSDEVDVETAMEALQDEDPEVRNALIPILRYSDDPLVIPPLLGLLHNPGNRDTAQAALESLCRNVETIQFGFDPRDEIQDDRSTLYDPELKHLAVPMPHLKTIAIYSGNCDPEQIGYLVCYATDVLEPSKIRIRAVVHGRGLGLSDDLREALRRCAVVEKMVEEDL